MDTAYISVPVHDEFIDRGGDIRSCAERAFRELGIFDTEAITLEQIRPSSRSQHVYDYIYSAPAVVV
ncbi:hypothetical protein [Nocardia sp. IFM 10818]